MKEIKNEKKEDQKSGINPVAAAVTGALIGAGAIVAGAIVMNDKSNQRKVKKVVSDAKEKIKGYKDEIKDKSQEVKNDAKEKMDKVSGKVKELLEVAKEPLDEVK